MFNNFGRINNKGNRAIFYVCIIKLILLESSKIVNMLKYLFDIIFDIRNSIYFVMSSFSTVDIRKKINVHY